MGEDPVPELNRIVGNINYNVLKFFNLDVEEKFSKLIGDIDAAINTKR